jgi:hypothetical protein
MGKLTWIRISEWSNPLEYAKELLADAGILESEMVYLSAERFTLYSKLDFISIIRPETRLILIGEFEGLDSKMGEDFFRQISKYKKYKYRNGLSLVLMARKGPDAFFRSAPTAQPSLPMGGWSVFPKSADEWIHEWIELSANKYGKRVLSLNPEVADFFEKTLMEKGEKTTRILVDEVVRRAEGERLCKITTEDGVSLKDRLSQ